jgi:hypothetical protein
VKSLRAQLTIRLLLGGTLLLGAAGAISDWQTRRAVSDEFDVSLRNRVQSLAGLTEIKRGKINFEFAGESMPQFEHLQGSEVFQLRTTDGREIERSLSLGTAELTPCGGSIAVPKFFDTTVKGRKLRCASANFSRGEDEDEDEGDRHPPQIEISLVVGRDRASLDDTLSTLRTSLLLVGTGALAALIGIVRWGVRGGLAPLHHLGENVAMVDAASLATRFPVEPLPEELRPLSSRLNELLARLESAFARERRFTANAAHELRTPLAELRTLAEVNLLTPSTELERVESWRDALSTTRRMESLALRLWNLHVSKIPRALSIANRWCWRRHAWPHGSRGRLARTIAVSLWIWRCRPILLRTPILHCSASYSQTFVPTPLRMLLSVRPSASLRRRWRQQSHFISRIPPASLMKPTCRTYSSGSGERIPHVPRLVITVSALPSPQI